MQQLEAESFFNEAHGLHWKHIEATRHVKSWHEPQQVHAIFNDKRISEMLFEDKRLDAADLDFEILRAYYNNGSKS